MKNLLLIGSLLLAGLTSGCAHYVTVENPPNVNLRQFTTVGLVQFTSDKEAMAKEVTQRFLATMQNAQPGVMVLQLGDAKSVLAAVGGTTFDPTTLKAIAQKWNVQAVITGTLTATKPTPRVRIGPNLNSLNATVQVDGALTATLLSTENGATIWTNGASGTWTLGGTNIGIRDPIQQHHQMLAELVRVTTRDFRTTWTRRKVETVK